MLAARDSIDALAYQMSVTRSEHSTNWEDLAEAYPRLLAAIDVGDAAAAELAVVKVLRL